MSYKNLSFADLELFVSLSESRSVRAVSREWGLNPSQVSKQLKRIENELDSKLFQRTTTGMNLTPEGATFRDKAKTVLNQIPSFNTLGQTQAEVSATYTLGSVNLINVHLLPAILNAVAREYPSIHFRTLDLAPDKIVNLGTKGVLDLSVHWGTFKWGDQWESKKVGEISHGLFARKGHPLGTQSNAKLVREYPFIVPVYSEGTQIRYGNDCCPLKMEQRILGHQTSTAAMAVELASTSDQLLYIPKQVGKNGGLQEIIVKEWNPPTQAMYLSVNIDRVSKPIFDRLTLELKKYFN